MGHPLANIDSVSIWRTHSIAKLLRVKDQRYGSSGAPRACQEGDLVLQIPRMLCIQTPQRLVQRAGGDLVGDSGGDWEYESLTGSRFMLMVVKNLQLNGIWHCLMANMVDMADMRMVSGE